MGSTAFGQVVLGNEVRMVRVVFRQIHGVLHISDRSAPRTASIGDCIAEVFSACLEPSLQVSDDILMPVRYIVGLLGIKAEVKEMWLPLAVTVDETELPSTGPHSLQSVANEVEEVFPGTR